MLMSHLDNEVHYGQDLSSLSCSEDVGLNSHSHSLQHPNLSTCRFVDSGSESSRVMKKLAESAG